MMNKKTWVKVKNGLIAPKHIAAMGNSIWLFLFIIDITDWETGKIYDWKDSDTAERMGLAQVTVRKYRQRLQEQGYITCVQKQYSQEITVNNWTNPRAYENELRVQDDTDISPLDTPNSQGDTQDDTQGDTQVIHDHITPTSYSHYTLHITHNVGWVKICEVYNLPVDVWETMLTGIQRESMQKLLERDAEKCVKIAVYYNNEGMHFQKMVGKIINNFDTWKTDSKKEPRRKSERII